MRYWHRGLPGSLGTFGGEIAVKREGKPLGLGNAIRIGELFGGGSCCWFAEERELNEWLEEDVGRRNHHLL